MVPGPAPGTGSGPVVSLLPSWICVTTEMTVALLWARAAARVPCTVVPEFCPQPGGRVRGTPAVGGTVLIMPDIVWEGSDVVISAGAVYCPCVAVSMAAGRPSHASAATAEKGAGLLSVILRCK